MRSSVLPASKRMARTGREGTAGIEPRIHRAESGKMQGSMSALALFVRWAHLASGFLVVGSFSTLLLAGRSDRPTAQRWEHQVLCLARLALLVAIVSGLAGLGVQTATLVGRAGAAFERSSLLRVLLDTHGGNV